MRSVLPVSYTHLDVYKRQGLPRTMFRIGKETEYAVVEMGMSHRGEIERLSRCARPDVGIITLSLIHILQRRDRHGLTEGRGSELDFAQLAGVVVLHKVGLVGQIHARPLGETERVKVIRCV